MGRSRREAEFIRHVRSFIPIALVLLLTSTAFAPLAGAAYLEPLAPLTSGRAHAVGVAVDGATYLFGGYTCNGGSCYYPYSGIRYDHETGASTTFSLPPVATYAAALWDGEHVLLIPPACAYCGAVSYYALDVDTLTYQARSMPLSAPDDSAFAWVDGSIYILGGYSCPYYCQDTLSVTRYTPATGETTVVGTLAEAARSAAVAVDGDVIYLVHGSTFNSTLRIQTFDTVTNTSALVGSAAYQLYAPAVAVAGGELTLFGGTACTYYSCSQSSAIRTLASDGTLAVSNVSLPLPNERAVAVADGGRVLVLGGVYCPYYCETLTSVTAYYTTPGAPTGVSASPGAAPLTIDLSWDAAPAAARVVAYEVYRSVEGGELSLVAQVDNATTSIADAPPVSTEAYVYAVKAINEVGASPMSDTACAIVSPLGQALIPPCALADDMTVESSGTGVGSGAGLVAVGGEARGEGYAVDAAVDGQDLPGLVVYDAGLVQEEVRQETPASPASADATVTRWSTPAASPCGLAFADECVAPLPFDPTRDRNAGAMLVVEAKVGEESVRVASPFLPYAGEPFGVLP